MENFVMHNPTIVHFGKGIICDLGNVVAEYGNNVLFLYGGGSIKKNNIYNQVMAELNGIGVRITEYGGIRPNPVVEDVDAAAKLGRKEHIDVILAVGGGSVIDSAKVVSIAIPGNVSGWDFYEGTFKPEKAVPLVAVLTLAATGSEMNPFAVIQNHDKKKKMGGGHDLMFPKHSFLDPEYTFTVPGDYTAYGIADLMVHCLEAYFGEGEATLSDRFVFSILKEAVQYGPALMDNLHDYELRAKIMYAATMALNKLTSYGRKNGDWGVHALGHTLSLLYDIPHGASLSIVSPAWMKHHLPKISDRIAYLGNNIFGVRTADDTIKAFENFYSKIGSPVSLSTFGIGADKKDEIMEAMIISKANGNHHKLYEEDYSKIIDLFV